MQKHLLALAAGVATLAFSSAAFAGDNNQARITQGGALNEFTAQQIGNSNFVGSGNAADLAVKQYGTENTFTSTQNGLGNLIGRGGEVQSTQVGDVTQGSDAARTTGNEISVTQTGDGNAVGGISQASSRAGEGNNDLTIVQRGDSSAGPNGNNLVRSVRQRTDPGGTGNTATINQIGNSNGRAGPATGSAANRTFTLFDNAPGATAALARQGARLAQTGSGNSATLTARGNGNSFNVDQSNQGLLSTPNTVSNDARGNNNYFFASQTGGNNQARSLMIGDANAFLVRQSGNGNTVEGLAPGSAYLQQGNGNTVEFIQVAGDNNLIQGRQTGDNNTYQVTQTGTGNNAYALQAGNNNVSVANQTGSSNMVRITQR